MWVERVPRSLEFRRLLLRRFLRMSQSSSISVILRHHLDVHSCIRIASLDASSTAVEIHGHLLALTVRDWVKSSSLVYWCIEQLLLEVFWALRWPIAACFLAWLLISDDRLLFVRIDFVRILKLRCRNHRVSDCIFNVRIIFRLNRRFRELFVNKQTVAYKSVLHARINSDWVRHWWLPHVNFIV